MLEHNIVNAIEAFQSGNLILAETLLENALKKNPGDSDVLNLLGLIKAGLGKHAEAANHLKSFLKKHPQDISALYNLVIALSESNQDLASIPFHEKLTQLACNKPEVWLNYGKSLANLQKYEEALNKFNRALFIEPHYVDALYNKSLSFFKLKNFDESQKIVNEIISLFPNFAPAYSLQGQFSKDRDDFNESLLNYDKALSINPNYFEAWSNRGNTLTELKRHDEALESYDKALSINPNYFEAWSNRGITLTELKRHDEALESYDKALSINPNSFEAWTNRGSCLSILNEIPESITSFKRALSLKPGDLVASCSILFTSISINEWSEYDFLKDYVIRELVKKPHAIPNFPLLSITDNEEVHLNIAKVQRNNLIQTRLPPLGFYPKRNKIKVGYYSADFRNHPVAHLIIGVIEQHSKTNFEFFGFSFGPKSDDTYRNRFKNAFNHFIDVDHLPDDKVAKLSRDYEIDIAVDLTCFTQFGRTEIFSHRAAPIQVNYLGYPSTTGSIHYDFIIADRILIPETCKKYYSENIVYLPNSYQPNDNLREISSSLFSREDLGLSNFSFVYCCFNNTYKFTPSVFQLWSRILNAVPGSCLWLLADSDLIKDNISKNFSILGVNPNRLVFANRLPPSEHLARLKMADLFLDTLPYNAHTTASDALWVGVPVLTRIGNSFAGRVAASLLNAIGLNDLITCSEEEYVSLAILLANDSEAFLRIKSRLINNKSTHSLFNTELSASNLELAYQKMYSQLHLNSFTDIYL